MKLMMVVVVVIVLTGSLLFKSAVQIVIKFNGVDTDGEDNGDDDDSHNHEYSS